MAVSWAVGVNTDAYGMETNPGDNVIYTEFESGKSRTILKNSAPKKVHSFMLAMEDSGASSEYKTFVAWWDDVLLSGSLSFLFPNLITHSGTKEYRATGSYSASGQRLKEVTITVEEM